MTMRLDHVHQFTEHHRYYVYRDFALSALDRRTIAFIYQPMVGATATAFYELLYHHVTEDRVGYSPLDPQRRLFLALGIEMNGAGRKRLADAASRLEAVGLLQTSRMAVPGGDDLLYEYELQPPLAPAEFFRNHHLALLLRDKLGKYAVIALREQFYAPEPDELAEAELDKQNVSVPFYELFTLNARAADDELEQALAEVAPSRPAAEPPGAGATAGSGATAATAGITYGELILRFPRNAANRSHVERLRQDEEGLAGVNYVAYKYRLSAADMCRLLDEDGVFAPSGELLFDELQRRASQLYRQDRKRDEERLRAAARAGRSADEDDSDGEPPAEYGVTAEFRLDVPEQLAGRCDVPQYNMLMRNEPHTRFLQRFFPGAVPEWLDREFERIDLAYKLPGAVINVLIHYVIGMNESQRVTKAFIESIAANMLVKGVDTFEKAVGYVREQERVERRKKEAEAAGGRSFGAGKARAASKGRGSAGVSRKPEIPIVEKRTSGRKLSAEELEAARRLASELDGQ